MLKEELRLLLGDVSGSEFEEAFWLYKATAVLSKEEFCTLWKVDKVLGGAVLGGLRDKIMLYNREAKNNPLFKEFAHPFHKSVFAQLEGSRLQNVLAELRGVLTGKES